MTARFLATSCALALCAGLSSRAEAAPRNATKASVARRASSPPTPPRLAALRAAPVGPPSAPAPVLSPSLVPGAEPTDPDRPSSDPSPLHHRAALTINPLALVVGRYGANIEFVFARHHAIVASGFLQTFPTGLLKTALPDLPIENGPESRFGGELGYRFYSGTNGPTGVFVGPSFVAMPLAAPRLTEAYKAEIVSFTAYGAALDVGVQTVIGPGFTIGGGIGVMALAYAPPASAQPPAGIELPSWPQPHVLPRLLVMAGWAF